MKISTKAAIAIFAIFICMPVATHQAAASDFVGVQVISVPSRERNRDFPVTVWYPATTGGKSVVLGDSKFFIGTEAMLDAPISSGRYPLILLSHGAGLGGTPKAVSWIATPLAKRGFIVAAPQHFGNGGAVRSAAETIKLWLRPADMSSTLDAMITRTVFADHLEPERVGALGLSMGGNTVLALAGGLVDPARLAGYCDDDKHNPSLCGWLKQSHVDLHSIDMIEASRDNRDSRIKIAMAIDPAPVDVFDAKSFARVSIPVEIVNLGRPGTIPLTALASGIANELPKSTYSTLTGASHFSMFGLCKPMAAELAKSADIDEPICSDGNGRSRDEIHNVLIDKVIEAFQQRLNAD